MTTSEIINSNQNRQTYANFSSNINTISCRCHRRRRIPYLRIVRGKGDVDVSQEWRIHVQLFIGRRDLAICVNNNEITFRFGLFTARLIPSIFHRTQCEEPGGASFDSKFSDKITTSSLFTTPRNWGPIQRKSTERKDPITAFSARFPIHKTVFRAQDWGVISINNDNNASP